MESVIVAITAHGFERTALPISLPIVVHGVPGCGKSHLLKQLLSNPEVQVCSYGPVHQVNLEGRRIEPAPVERHCEVLILDEYHLQEDDCGADFLFGDPNQARTQVKQAHFVKKDTRRFGSDLCHLLNSLGYQISSIAEHQTEIVYGNIFGTVIQGTVLCFEKEVCSLLDQHNCAYLLPEEAAGLNIDSATFITARTDLQEIVSPNLFICLTRAVRSLQLLGPAWH